MNEDVIVELSGFIWMCVCLEVRLKYKNIYCLEICESGNK